QARTRACGQWPPQGLTPPGARDRASVCPRNRASMRPPWPCGRSSAGQRDGEGAVAPRVHPSRPHLQGITHQVLRRTEAMIRTPIADLRAHVGETVTIAGWAKTLRLQRAMQFVVVRDHTGAVQVTHRRDGTALESALASLTAESAVRITGRVQGNPVVSLGALELIP